MQEIVAVIGRQYPYVLRPGNEAGLRLAEMLGRKTLSYEALAAMSALGHVVTFEGTRADVEQAHRDMASLGVPSGVPTQAPKHPEWYGGR